MTVKAIQTRYAGCHFRSRLEARWAVFFDALGISWEYEPQGYQHEPWADGTVWRYLPDFYLPDLGCFVEVKGNTSQITDDYLTMLGHVGHFLPGVHSSWGTTRGLVLLGEIPRTDHGQKWSHCHLTHHKGLQIQSLYWKVGGAEVHDRDVYVPDIYSLGYRTDNMDEGMLPHVANPRGLWDPYTWHIQMPGVANAYTAARSARFEHSQSGAT